MELQSEVKELRLAIEALNRTLASHDKPIASPKPLAPMVAPSKPMDKPISKPMAKPSKKLLAAIAYLEANKDKLELSNRELEAIEVNGMSISYVTWGKAKNSLK